MGDGLLQVLIPIYYYIRGLSIDSHMLSNDSAPAILVSPVNWNMKIFLQFRPWGSVAGVIECLPILALIPEFTCSFSICKSNLEVPWSPQHATLCEQGLTGSALKPCDIIKLTYVSHSPDVRATETKAIYSCT